MDAMDGHFSEKWPSTHPFQYPACISHVNHPRFHPDIHRYHMKHVTIQLDAKRKIELMAYDLERSVNYPWMTHGSPYNDHYIQPILSIKHSTLSELIYQQERKVESGASSCAFGS
jgi:hypothetical protein